MGKPLYNLSMKSTVTLDRTSRVVTRLQKERGVWVLRAGKLLSADEAAKTLRTLQARRHRRNVGKKLVKAFFEKELQDLSSP
jgi:hypothetical protein